MKAATEKPPDPDHVVRIRDQLGPCVLLKVPIGEKGPRIRGWQRLRQTDMTPEYLASLNHGQNIGVLLGAASEGLCTIDVDDDDRLEDFLSLNPHLRESLISRGSRGGNIWLRIKGPYPPNGKIKTLQGGGFGEWRADGWQTIIYGQHKSGCRYRDNGKHPLEIEFKGLNWPEGLNLPGRNPRLKHPIRCKIGLSSLLVRSDSMKQQRGPFESWPGPKRYLCAAAASLN